MAVEGFYFGGILEAMKTTIDIPEKSLRDAMRFTGAKTKREAVVTALEDFNRRKEVEALIAMAGSFPDFPTNDEIEAQDIEDTKQMRKLWAGGK